MAISKSTNSAIADTPSNATLDDLHGAAQREDRRASPNATAAIGTQRKLSRNEKPSTRGKKTKAGTLAKRKKRAAGSAKTRSPETKAPQHKGTSKAEAIISLLRRSRGASLAEMMTATGWQAHSVRGFLSATVKRRMGMSLTSERDDRKDRRYRIV